LYDAHFLDSYAWNYRNGYDSEDKYFWNTQCARAFLLCLYPTVYLVLFNKISISLLYEDYLVTVWLCSSKHWPQCSKYIWSDKSGQCLDRSISGSPTRRNPPFPRRS